MARKPSNGRAPAPPAPPPATPPKPRRRRAAPDPPAPPITDPPAPPIADPPAASIADPPQPSAPGRGGRLASDIRRRAPDYFLDPLIPSGSLTFVVGDPRTGKSTLGAWLCAQARRAVILPGQEESVECALVPRLAAAGCDLTRILVADSRLWSFPHNREDMSRVLASHNAELLWIDPIDSYVGEAPENDGQAVRAALESLARIATDTGCAVVCARHPGKTTGNLCPGSRQWRAVPREIIELCLDDGPPVRRILRLRRDPFSRDLGPREYHLDGPPREPKVFRLGDAIAVELADTLGVGDPVDRWAIDEACELLRALLAEAEQESLWIYAQCAAQQLAPRTVRYAARRIGVVVRREGSGREHRSVWSLGSTPATPAR